MIGNVARSRCNSWEDVTEYVLPQIDTYDKNVYKDLDAQIQEKQVVEGTVVGVNDKGEEIFLKDIYAYDRKLIEQL